MIPTTRVSAIAIISKNRGLGYENKLLFHIPGELPRFKKITMGHPVIMGRKTYESIGKPLPGRLNIIITRDPHYKVEGAVVVDSLDEALRQVMTQLRWAQGEEGNIGNYSSNEERSSQPSVSNNNSDKDELFIIGGGQIFAEALPKTDRLYLTIVDHEVPADVFFPDYESQFTKVIEKEEKTDWEYPYTFITLEKPSSS